MKRIVILGASLYYIKVIQNIKKLGYYVIALDKNSQAPGFSYADEFAPIDISDKFKVYEYVKNRNIDGIMAINDFGTRTAFYVSQKLGLINPTYLTGICGNDKGIMREIWEHENLPQPKFIIFNDLNDIDLIERKISYPLVIKPTDAGGGGRGISVAYDKEELIDSINHAKKFAKNNRMIAEEFIEGVEATIDCIIYQGKVYILAISDKIKPKSKFFVATSLNFPANFSNQVINKIEKLSKLAIESLGITNGAAHIEMIINNSDIKLVEIGIRGGGGHVFNTIIEQTTGINAPQQLAKILCKEEPNLEKKFQKGACYRFFNPKQTGRIKKIEYDKDIVSSNFVVDFAITTKVGDVFNGLIDSMNRIGFVVTVGKTREEAIKYADLVEESIKFEFENE